MEYDYILRYYVNMGSLSERIHYQTLILVFKSINSLDPAYINELFKLRLVRYKLPVEIRQLNDIKTFRNAFYAHNYVFKINLYTYN